MAVFIALQSAASACICRCTACCAASGAPSATVPSPSAPYSLCRRLVEQQVVVVMLLLVAAPKGHPLLRLWIRGHLCCATASC
jgi:hypothetical protein